MGVAPRTAEAIAAAVAEICLGLPETREGGEGGTRNFTVRRQSFCLYLAVESPSGGMATVLVIRPSPDEREAFIAMGHPFFEIRNNTRKIGFVLDDATDWEEVRELVTDSYCLVAPKKLVALLDLPPAL